MNRKTGSLLLWMVFMLGCSQQANSIKAADINGTTPCSLDGMILKDYPGPKGQMHYSQGEPDFFCDTLELFAIYLRPEQKKRVTALFTQDMGQTDWEHPEGHWIDAKTATYVLGSSKTGSMGPTLASFAKPEQAAAFAKQFGGKTLKFSEVTLDMVALDGGAQHDGRM